MAEFNLYRVYYYSAPQYAWDARIDLSMDGHAMGTLLFMKAGETIPANANAAGIPQLHYSIRDLPAMLTMLREEKPLFVSFNAGNGIGTVSTGSEPVGEQEGV
jgi:hypothetical protein